MERMDSMLDREMRRIVERARDAGVRIPESCAKYLDDDYRITFNTTPVIPPAPDDKETTA